MERFKPAAGRLATIFYKRGTLRQPRIPKSDVESPSSQFETPATELSDSNEKAISPQQSRRAFPTGHTFLWQDLSLDLKDGTGEKRLLDKVTGTC